MISFSGSMLLVSSPLLAAEPPNEPAAASAPAPPDEVTAAAVDDLHVALGAGGHFALGIAPAVALGTRLTAEVATKGWSLGIEGRYDAPASTNVRTSLVGGSFVPCLRSKGSWACAVVLASRVTVDSASASDARFFVGIGARLEMHFSLPFNFALRLCGEVLAHPIPYELTAEGHRVLKSSVVSALFGPMLVHAF